MRTEIFETIRDFNNKYPSKFYICANCGRLIPDKYTCMYCKWRADGLFKTKGKGLRYRILENGLEEEIFVPTEFYFEQIKTLSQE